MSAATATVTRPATAVDPHQPAGVGAVDDRALVARIRGGDERAFEELYRLYRRPLLSFLRRLTGDDARAEDLLQETFLSALRRIRSSEQDLALKPWLFEIARNAAIDSWRRTNRADEVPLEGVFGSGREPSGEPDVEVSAREQLKLLRGAFDELPPQQARALVMRELEGRSYEEIAGELALSRSAVESTIFRARRRLEREYELLADGSRCRSARDAVARITSGGARAADERMLARHCRRCALCRRYARAHGVEPLRTLVDKVAAALSPLPLFFERLASQLAGTAMPAAPELPGVAGKGVAAAVAALAALGAAVGLEGDKPASRLPQQAPLVAPQPSASSASPQVSRSPRERERSAAPRRSSDEQGAQRVLRDGRGRPSTGSDSRLRHAPNSASAGASVDRSNPQSSTGLPLLREVDPRRGASDVQRSAGGVVGGVGETLGNTVQGTGSTVGGVVGGVGSTVGGTTRALGGAVGDATGNQRLGGAIGGAGTTIEGAVNGLGATIQGLTDGVGGAVKGLTGGGLSR